MVKAEASPAAAPLMLSADELLKSIRDENTRHRTEILRLERMLGMATKGVAVGATLAYEDGGTLLIEIVDIDRQCVTGTYTVTKQVPFSEIEVLWSKTNG